MADDETYKRVLDALREIAEEVRDYKAKIESDWQIHRGTVNSAIGLLSGEVVRMQNIVDASIKERKDERQADDVGRTAERKKAGYFRWVTIALIALLIVVNCALIAAVVAVYVFTRGA